MQVKTWHFSRKNYGHKEVFFVAIVSTPFGAFFYAIFAYLTD